MPKILITGCAGFIGYHCAEYLLNQNYQVVGIDNLNDYYDVQLKNDRIKKLEDHNNFQFYTIDILNEKVCNNLFEYQKFDYVINLAADAGVRYSTEYPRPFIHNNIVGFWNILDLCYRYKVQHLVYASSSSVYEYQEKPSSESDNTDHPLSIYGATKKCNEILAHSYFSLFGLNVTGMRFYTVFGPYGRPDMAFGLFADALVNHKPMCIFNNGEMWRDFTYVDNIVQGIMKSLFKPQGYKIYNLGTGTLVKLSRMVELLEQCFQTTTEKILLPMQPGDLLSTCADISLAQKDLGYQPGVFIEAGIEKFVTWYKEYYGQKR